MKKQNGCKNLSLFLIFVLMLGVVNTGRIAAYAEEEAEITGFTLSTTPSAITVTVYEEEPKGTITSFEELGEDIRWQNTREPVLPEKVKGIVEGRAMDIPVTWEADHDYGPDSPESGLYVFTAKADGDFILADGAEAPRITVYIPKVKRMMLFMAGSADLNDPLVITTAAQLSEIASLVNAGKLESFIFNDNSTTVYLKLGNDIDLSGYGSGYGWTPIGTSNNPFKGNFDGSGKTITGLRINRSGSDYMGLFGYIDGGMVKSVGVTNVDIYGKNYVGSVAGYVDSNGTVQNCYNTGNVKGGGYYVGGVAGYVDNNSVVQNCYSSGSVSGSGHIGGVAGYVAHGAVQNCYSTGSVKGSGKNVGGIAGYVADGGTVQNCAALNSFVSGTDNVGRVVGNNEGTLSGNIAFTWMDVLVNGSPKPAVSGVGGIDGQSKTAAYIRAEGTIGGLFTSADGWSTQNGKLPGLGNTVDMPAYIEDKTSDDSYFPGSGSEYDPFQIATAEQLAKLAELVNSDDTSTRNEYNNKYYKLTDDIDLSAYGNGLGWMPIGTSESKPFQGHFDGKNKIITGLMINRGGEYYIGLFGVIDKGTVKNVGLTNVNIYGTGPVGAVVGYLIKGSTVQNCYSSGSVSASYKAGGVVGEAKESIVQNCYSTANVGNIVTLAGGIVGNIYDCTVENCYSSGSINGVNVGGVAGGVYWENSTVKNCYSSGSISGSICAGGIAGDVKYDSAVQYCYSIASVRGNTAGGIAGDVKYDSAVQNCAALNPSVSGTGNVGRVVGNNEGTLSGNIAFTGMNVLVGGNSKTLDEGADKVDGQSMTAANIKADRTIGDLFTSAGGWSTQNGKLPGLFGKTVDIPIYIEDITSDPNFLGEGTSDKPFQIASAEQLAKLAELVNAGTSPYADTRTYYRLENDIDLSGYGSTYRGGKGWVPIGAYNKPFKGKFIGNNKKISGLYINDSSLDYAGLFGCIDGGSVESLTLSGVNINGKNYVGGLAGKTNGTVQCCYVDGVVKGRSYVGGLVSWNENGNILNCYTTGTVSGNDGVGGVAGVAGGTIQYCYSTAAVNGTANVGGVSGNVTGSVKNSVALNPSVSSNNTAIGRVIGTNSGSLVKNYSFSGMKVNGKTISDGTLNDINGGDLFIDQIYNMDFWTDPGNWEENAWDDSSWSFETGKLPILRDLPGQSGNGGLYLIKRDITGASVETTVTYTGTEVTPKITFDGVVLRKDIDYIVTFTSTDGNGTSGGTNVGTVNMEVTGNDGFTGTISNIEYTIEQAELTVSGGIVSEKIYDGTSAANVTEVTFNGLKNSETLKPGIDYTVTGAEYDSTGAGDGKTVTATVTLLDSPKARNYTLTDGSLSITGQTIGQAELTVSGGIVSEKTYDGTVTANVTEVTFDGLQNNETLEFGKDYTVTGAEFDGAEAGNGKTVTATVTLLNTPKTRNYTLTDGSLSITGQTVAKAAAPAGLDKSIEVVAGLERDYEFDMTALIPNVTGTLGNITYTPGITLIDDGILGALNYQSGNILVLPVQAVDGEGKTAQVTVSIQSDNYNTFDAVITLETVAAIPLTINGITVDN